MTHRRSSLPLAACAALAAFSAAPAFAQAPAIPAPGVCVFDRDAVFGDSLVGKSVGEQLRKLVADADAAMKAERATIEKDAASFRQLQAALPAEQRNSRAAELQKRAEASNAKADTNRREIEGAERAALQRMMSEVSPLVQQVGTQQKCGIVVDQKVVFGYFNPDSMNLTKAVITALDAKLKTIPVSRSPQTVLTRPATKK